MVRYYVVSHTHWDREWYQPLEVMKTRLVHLMDALIDIIEKDGDYVFHLDEQTVVLEDYLSVRPERERILKKYIRSGNIIVGPWYLQNDFYYSSGEATIRNLQTGLALAKKFGNVNRAGYAPDNFGIISQLPQIFNNFGIDTLLFGRGYEKWAVLQSGEKKCERRKTEFIWEGADGSRLYSSFMLGWYNNAQRFPDDIEKSLKLIQLNEENFEGLNESPYLLLMNGVDHLEPQENIREIIAEINDRAGEEVIAQTTIEEYLGKVKKVLQASDAPYVFRGELKQGDPDKLLRHCASSRVYLKRLNVIAQNRLERELEPLYAMLGLAGADFSAADDYFTYLWKNRLKQLPHDNVCGCSADSVNRHMEDLFEREKEGMDRFYTEGMQFACEHVKVTGEAEDRYKIVFANTASALRRGLLYAALDLPVDENIKKFRITDDGGNSLPYEILSKNRVWKDIISPLNAPFAIDSYRYRIAFDGGEINPYSIKAFLLSAGKGKRVAGKAAEYITNGKITLAPNGNGVELICGNRRIDNLFEFEDSYDCGDAYRYKNYSTTEYRLKYKLKKVAFKQSALMGTAFLTYELHFPETFDSDTRERSEKTVKTVLDVKLTLEKDSDTVKIDYNFVNKAKNHRFRIIFNSDVAAEAMAADAPFDITYYDKKDDCPLENSNTYSNSSFACLEGGDRGFCVFTEGQHETEHNGDKLIFTLVRSTGAIYADKDGRVAGGTLWSVPENQCLREIKGRFGVKLYSGDLCAADIPVASALFAVGAECYFDSCDRKKFHGGAFFHPDPDLHQLYYPKDVYPELKIENNAGIIKCEGKGIAVSCVKKAINGKGYILRAYNFTPENAFADITFGGKIYLTDAEEKTKKFIGKNSVRVEFGQKKILTFRLVKERKK